MKVFLGRSRPQVLNHNFYVLVRNDKVAVLVLRGASLIVFKSLPIIKYPGFKDWRSFGSSLSGVKGLEFKIGFICENKL